MCGFAGLLDPEGVDQAKADTFSAKVSEVLKHRGPDASGEWIDGQAGLVLSHRRLSIVDSSDAGLQPMVSGSGRYVICFNGEIYNHRLLRLEINKKRRDYGWRGRSDTETLLASIEIFGLLASLKKLDGMFAFALWDRQNRALYLTRDRVGEKPLYYGKIKSTWFFGSELKALHAHSEFLPQIDGVALSGYFKYGCIQGSRSIFEGVSKIKPGTFVRIDARLDHVGVHSYWSLDDGLKGGGFSLGDDDQHLSINSRLQNLDSVLGDAVEKQMQAEVPLGAFLSGGIDSSLIVSLMKERSCQKVQTFSVGFEDKGYDESIYATKVARHLGTEHHQIPILDKTAMEIVPLLPTMFDEPFSDSSQIPTFLVSSIAKQHVKVALSGDGADELFGGYNRYTWGASTWSKLAKLPLPIRNVVYKVFSSIPPKVLDIVLSSIFSAFPGKYRHQQIAGKLDKLARLLHANNSWDLYSSLASQSSELEKLLIDVGPDFLVDRSMIERASAISVPEQMMYWDFHGYLTDDILVKVDRAAMAVSLETRMPFLDPKVIDSAWQLPIDAKIKNGHGKWCLKELLYKRVPRSLIERPKMGFGVPMDAWLRGPLREWAEHLLERNRLRSGQVFNEETVRRKWQDHLSGDANWGHELWSVLMFEAWADEWLNK